MTNYERICADKAFCASVIAEISNMEGCDCDCYGVVMNWLDTEQREVNDERAQEAGEESR